jgi:hypothetical protein
MAHLKRRSPRSTSRKGSRRGVSIVESAFMIPILMSLIFGSIEFGSILHMRHTMLHAAREAARTLAVENGTISQAVSVAETVLPDSDDLDFEVSASQPHPDDFMRDVEVEIKLPLKQASLGDVFGMFGEDYMTVRVTMRSEQ